jgi:hypothetical protein
LRPAAPLPPQSPPPCWRPPAVDPIYAAIKRHKQAAAVYDAAVNVRADFNDVTMNDEQTKQLAVLEDAVDEAWEPREEAVIDLVNTKPTTLAGVVALCRYIEPLLNDDSDLPEVISWDDETESSVAAFANVIAAAIGALIKAQAGKEVQS